MSTPNTSTLKTGDRLSWTEKIGYASGDFASCLYFGIFMNFLGYFYTDVYGISAAAVGTMLFAVRTYDWIKDPIMGVIADRTVSPMGRYRPWLLWMVGPYVVLGILAFTTFDLGPTGKLVYAYVTYILLTMVYTAINVPYSALMGVMTADANERTALSSFRFVGSALGGLVVYGTLLWLVKALGNGNDQKGFSLTVAIYAFLAAVAFVFTFLSTKERVQPPTKEKPSISTDLKKLIRNGPWIVMIFVSLLTIVGMGMRSGVTLYYFKYLSGNEQLASGFFVVGSVTQIAAVLLTEKITAVLGGKKKTYVVLMSLIAVLNFAFYFIDPRNQPLIVAHQIASTIVAAPLFPLFWSMIGDTAAYGLWKYGQTSTGLLFSAGTFSQKIGWSIGPALSLWVLAYFGFVSNTVQTAQSAQCILVMMSLVPAFFALLTVFAVSFYRIDNAVQDEMAKALSK